MSFDLFNICCGKRYEQTRIEIKFANFWWIFLLFNKMSESEIGFKNLVVELQLKFSSSFWLGTIKITW
jgi:hypothetical protein